jgi:hypothetical protein
LDGEGVGGDRETLRMDRLDCPLLFLTGTYTTSFTAEEFRLDFTLDFIIKEGKRAIVQPPPRINYKLKHQHANSNLPVSILG